MRATERFAAGSEAVEDYVRAISRTARGARRVASTTEVAAFLAVTPASVSSMFKKLAHLELVVYVPYRGVSLTAAGVELALRMTRRHRLLETFLVEVLEMPIEHVHREADRLEHHISGELETLIAARLGRPVQDPHGDPIPTADLSMSGDDTVGLADLPVGRGGVIARVPDADPAVLAYLVRRARIPPGTRFVVLERQPFGGPLVLAVGARRVGIESGLAALVRARVDEPPADAQERHA